MINNKIDSLLRLNGLNYSNYADALGIFKQAMSNKKKSKAYKAKDLATLAQLTNTKLVFLNDDGSYIEITKEDFE